METARPPLLTCEPVLTEAAFLLKREGRDTDTLFALLDRGIIRIGLSIEDSRRTCESHAALPQSADVASGRVPGQAL